MPQSFSPNESRHQTRRRARPKLTPNPKLRLREQVHEVTRFLHFSERTEETYWQWIVRFLKFYRDHPHLTPPIIPSPGLRPPSPIRWARDKRGRRNGGIHGEWGRPRCLGSCRIWRRS